MRPLRRRRIICDRRIFSPCTWSLPFWAKPVSVFGLFLVTTVTVVHFRSSVHPTLAPDRLDAGSRKLSSRRLATLSGKVTLSPELRTSPLPATHVRVGYWWQNTRLCFLLLKAITARQATSCRTKMIKVIMILIEATFFVDSISAVAEKQNHYSYHYGKTVSRADAARVRRQVT